MPCPYFIPIERFDDAAWAHPSRMPLGAGFRGVCSAPASEGYKPTDSELKTGCNLGYARSCPRLPQERQADAVRFSILRERDGKISICYVSELNYLPGEHGILHYDVAQKRWLQPGLKEGLRHLAECFLKSYLARKGNVDG